MNLKPTPSIMITASSDRHVTSDPSFFIIISFSSFKNKSKWISVVFLEQIAVLFFLFSGTLWSSCFFKLIKLFVRMDVNIFVFFAVGWALNGVFRVINCLDWFIDWKRTWWFLKDEFLRWLRIAAGLMCRLNFLESVVVVRLIFVIEVLTFRDIWLICSEQAE